MHFSGTIKLILPTLYDCCLTVASDLNSVFRPNRFRLEGGAGENYFRREQGSTLCFKKPDP